jgi:hypothetical protein
MKAVINRMRDAKMPYVSNKETWLDHDDIKIKYTFKCCVHWSKES